MKKIKRFITFIVPRVYSTDDFYIIMMFDYELIIRKGAFK